MTEVLLQHKSSTRKLLVLFALFLLPLGAWAQNSITVAGTTVSASGSITGDGISGTVSINFETNTLTLEGATLTNYIHWETDADLTIELKGANSINFTDGSCIVSNHDRKISFIQGDASNPCSLTLSCGREGVIGIGFSNYSAPIMGAGLYWFPTKENNYITSATVKTILSGGDGTWESPLLIKNYNDLKDFATYVNNGTLTTEHIKLDADIDCTGKTDFTPIGTESKPFQGDFYGNNKTISNLHFISTESTNFAGLFGKVESSKSSKMSVEKLTLSNCTFKGGDMTGAIAAFLSIGTIKDCIVKNCTLETGNPQSPECGGIAGRLDQGKIMGCVVSGGSITAATTYTASPGTSYAGGIVGKCYKNKDNTINECQVVTGGGDVTITSSHANTTSALYAGAIIGGTENGDGSELTLESNGYDSRVTTSTMAGTAEAVVKSGQTQRGIGNSDDVIGQVELAGTKKVTVETESVSGNDRWDAVEGTYYTKTITNGYAQIDYYVLSGRNFTFSMKPKNGYKPRFALSEPTIEVTTKEIIEDGAYDHTEFTFTMPNADLEVIWSYPIDLEAISADNFSIDDANYTGEAIVPTIVKVTGVPTSGTSHHTRRLEKDRDFIITGYKQNGQSVTSPVEKGTYTVTIEGMGDFIGTQDVSYRIIKAYDLWINGTQISELNAENFYGDENETVKFTPATEANPTNILTLNNASINGEIKSGLDNLTIHLTGDNTITATGSETSLITSSNNGVLVFETDETSGGRLDMVTKGSSAPFEGFADGKITYDKLVYWYDNTNEVHTIQAPTIPVMALDADEKVTLTKPYADGDIYYTIVYADGKTPEVKKTKYTAAFAMEVPGTVEAWAEANGATTDKAKGKHFGYQDAPYTMAIDDTKTPTLLPAIAEGDALALSEYTSDNSDIATFADGLITAKELGTTTLSVTLAADNTTPFKVLNSAPGPNEYAVSFSVKVGATLDNYFVGSNEYATYYNDDDEIYAVPDGMKAYVVTGASGSMSITEESPVLPPLAVVLLKKGTATLFTKTPAEGSAPAGNLLKHATDDVPVTSESSIYVLYNNEFVKASPGSIPTGKNYLDLSAPAASRNLIIDDAGETTGIVSMDNGKLIMDNEAGAQWYDLQGRRIQKPTKAGIYIQNGKKTIIK